jgi:hypothetical protein
VRKVLVVLVLAIVGVLAAATAAEADSLRTNHNQRVRGKKVTYAGTATGCRRVVIASRPVGKKRALNRQTKRVVGGRFRFNKVVRAKAALRTHSVRVHCVQDGRLVGKKSLKVVKQLAFGGPRPVLPQLLLGLGLLEAGGILVAIGRRPQFPKTRLRTRRGPSGAQRKSVHVYAD